MISPPLSPTGFVGRSEERAFLLARFEATRSGLFSAVVIEGDSGIGKTRLLEEFRTATASEAGFGLGCCLEYARAPYQPLNDVFGQLGLQIPGAPKPDRTGVTPDDKLAHFSSIAAALAKCAARRPLVIAIEDLQWADDATIELIQYVCRALRSAPIQLLVTMNTDALRESPNLGSLVARLRRLGASHIRLGPLSREDVRTMVSVALGGRAEYSSDLLMRIEEASDGNPLFVEELLRTALEKHGATSTPLSEIPMTIRAMLWERIAPLSNRDRDILTHAAVIGRSFDADFLANITAQSKKEVFDVLQRARALQLLVDQPGNPPTYRFRHALLRETFYRELLPDVAGPLHARIAAKLEDLPNPDSRLAERAYHWTIARIEDRAIDCNERAGDAAASVYAFSDAIRFYRQALQFRYPSGIRRASLYERLARLMFFEGRETEPGEWLDRALEEYKRLGDREGMVRVFLVAASQYWLDGQTERSIEAATPAVDMLLAEQRDGPLLAYARSQLARFLVTLGRAEEAMHQLNAVPPEIIPDDHEFGAAFWEIKGETEAAFGSLSAAGACYENALRIANQTNDSHLIVRIENSFGMSAMDLGELQTASEHFERAIQVAEQHALTWRYAYASANYAMVLFLAGDFEEAQRRLLAALTAPMNGPLRMRVAVVGVPLSLALGDETLLNRTAEERVIDDAFRSGEAQRIGAAAAAFASLYAARGDNDAAKDLLAKAVQALSRLHRSWLLPAAVAEHCDPAEIDRVSEMLRALGPHNRIALAHGLLVDAIRMRRFNPGSAVAEKERKAAAAFHELGWRVPIISVHNAPAPVSTSSNQIHSRLTKRQSEVADLIARGNSNQEIATALSISENTVEHHISEIYSRLNVASRSQLVARMIT
jgi:DNA-binding CsgD family transcriptional regulator/tetratricopeptide (TPR) repeat protein